MSFSIPKITDERLEALYKRIKPLVRRGRLLWLIKRFDFRTIAFTWDPTKRRPAFWVAPLADIRTLHTYGYYGFFKPSIAEVLAQIPEEYMDETVAFEVDGPGNAEDLNSESEALNAGYHVASTRLYRRKRLWQDVLLPIFMR